MSSSLTVFKFAMQEWRLDVSFFKKNQGIVQLCSENLYCFRISKGEFSWLGQTKDHPGHELAASQPVQIHQICCLTPATLHLISKNNPTRQTGRIILLLETGHSLKPNGRSDHSYPFQKKRGKFHPLFSCLSLPPTPYQPTFLLSSL